jgi:ABC-2 type transport system ATP-binding protein
VAGLPTVPHARPQVSPPRVVHPTFVPTAIRVENLVKRYDGRPPVEAVRGLDLVIEQGECFGLLGPNGAGKTTTIEIIEGLLSADSGEVEVLGLHWGRHDDAIRQRIGISLQETRLSEKLSVLETLTLFRSFYRHGIEPAEAMRRVSLEEKAKAWVGKLSGGQKQRLAVACAIVGDPELLFLDEPTTGLDPQSRRQLWEIIRGFREQGRTVLLTTHYMDEAERLCDRVAIVDQGRVIALGTPRELIASLGGEHVIEITLDDACVIGRDSGPLPLPLGEGPPAVSLPNGGEGSAIVGSNKNTRLAPESLTDLPTVISTRAENGHVCLSVTEPHLVLPALLDRLKELNCELTSLNTRHASLEDVFMKLAGRHLSDE